MSALAKFFVVFNLVLTVFFFGASATLYLARQNWRLAHEDFRSQARAELAQLQEKNNSVVGENSRLEQNVSRLKSELENTGLTNKNLREENSDKEKRLQGAQQQVQSAQEAVAQTSKLLESKEARNSDLLGQLQAANTSRDEALTSAESANSAANSIRLDLEKSQQELHALRVAMNELNEDHEELSLKYNALRDRCPGGAPEAVPLIEGQIVDVDTEEDLVVLSVGRDDNVEEGHSFTVYRGDSFVGKVEVFRVYPGLSGARVLYTKPGEEVARGDQASTRIN